MAKRKPKLEITLDPIVEKERGFSADEYRKALEQRLKGKYTVKIHEGTSVEVHQCGVGSIQYQDDFSQPEKDSLQDAVESVWHHLRSEKSADKTLPAVQKLYSKPAKFFICVELGLIAFLFFLVHSGFSIENPYFLSGFGGVAGAWLHMLDVLCNHKTLSIAGRGKADAGWNEVSYLAARSILGAAAGLVSYGVFGGADWFTIAASAASHAANLSPVATAGARNAPFHLLCLGLLAGFSTTTLASLSKASEKRAENFHAPKHGKREPVSNESDSETAGDTGTQAQAS